MPALHPAAARRGRSGFPEGYQPALDGMRALAVLAVLLFHAGVAWAPGGLLGVDAFFVLSGYLITGLLLREVARTGRIDLRAFWARRLRRLLPALLLVLLAVAGYAMVAATPGALSSIRSDAFAALGYVANWRFAVSDQGYFDHFSDPSPLLHTWSLAVEEQFYLLWPLVVLVVARRSADPARAVGKVAVAGAGGSAALMALMYAAGVGTDRLYYGTDTRVLALLAGAALAAHQEVTGSPLPRFRHRRLDWPGRLALALVGWAGLVGLGHLVLTVDGQSPLLYLGGFLVVALCAVALVAGVTALPRSPLARLLSLPWLVGLGRISYGVYLWHWPVFLIVSGGNTGSTGPGLVTLRLAVTVTVAALSYRFVEQPIRAQEPLVPFRLHAPVLAGLTAVAVVVATPAATGLGGPLTIGDLSRDVVTVDSLTSQAPVPAPAAPGPAAPVEPVRMLLVGDSVSLTAANAVRDLTDPWRVDLAVGSLAGCGIAPGQVSADGPDRSVPTDDAPRGRLCRDWPALWTSMVDRVHPQVSVLVNGVWEAANRLVGDRWMSLGDPEYDDLLRRETHRAVEVLSARGGKVVLALMPCVRVRELPDGGIWPFTLPERAVRFNEIVREVAAAYPDVVSVLDLYALLCPGGRFSEEIDGVVVRHEDGTHMSPTAGPVLAPALFGAAREAVGLPARPE